MRKLFYILELFVAAAVAGCGRDAEVVKAKAVDAAEVRHLFDEDSVGPYNHPLLEMPAPNTHLKVNSVGRLDEVFNDSNFVQWAEAERIGIEPLTDVRSHFDTRRPLVKITSCADFYVEELTHSRPYMIPEGAALVHEIGRRFNDSLAARGGGKYRIKVTSVLRTPANVRRLRRSNRNAIDSSVHQLATTVDISYARFAVDATQKTHSAEELKALLAEVLYAMRLEGKCWVKYEKKQPCFHLTVRSPRIPLEQ